MTFEYSLYKSSTNLVEIVPIPALPVRCWARGAKLRFLGGDVSNVYHPWAGVHLRPQLQEADVIGHGHWVPVLMKDHPHNGDVLLREVNLVKDIITNSDWVQGKPDDIIFVKLKSYKPQSQCFSLNQSMQIPTNLSPQLSWNLGQVPYLGLDIIEPSLVMKLFTQIYI